MDAYDRTILIGKSLAIVGILGTAVCIGGAIESANNPAPTLPPVSTSWEQGETIILTPCPTEDSTGCYWDASIRGNKVGQSFVNINGNVYYKPQP